MAKSLVIVESPAKAKTINKILGDDFVVKASMGHIRDLPIKKMGVDIEHGFKPEYVVVKEREKIIKELVRIAKDCDAVYLAPDPDREGEAIAWHLQAVLEDKVAPEKFHRVSYNEITPSAVRAAFGHPTKIDQNRVDAQQARRVLDRIVGYKVSPLLWSRVKRGLSAGRVQSVALRLLCEREAAIRGFVPQEYWVMGVRARKKVDPLDPFSMKLAKIDGKPAEIKSPERAEEVLRDLDDRPLRVQRIIQREMSKRAMPPFITSTLQQAASSVYGFSPDRTMRIAQSLYEGIDVGEGPVGVITYMRTDSFTIAKEALEACRGLIATQFGSDYLPPQPNVYRSRSGAQEAHEAIRPTDVDRSPETLSGRLSEDQQKLYTLIWKRFVASQMAPARIAQRTAEVEAVPPAPDRPAYQFRATASQVVFQGYMLVMGGSPGVVKDKDKTEDEEEEVESLPPLAEGEMLDRIEWLHERKETQPPGRYSEASLIRALEENGVGRPSTYASIISTLHNRRYVKLEKRALFPTDLGMEVSLFLVTHLNDLFDVTFTAQMEKALDEIEQGSVQWGRMLADFFKRFEEWMLKAKGPAIEPARVLPILDALLTVKEWAPTTLRGKKPVGDQPFTDSIRKKVQEEAGAISERQLDALARIAWRYRKQMPEIERVLEASGLTHITQAPDEPPQETVIKKLALLKDVQCVEPVKRGNRTFDDRAFINSLQSQVTAGRHLSLAQVTSVDRLLVKYQDQVPDFERVTAELGMTAQTTAPDNESGPLLETLKSVKAWNPPVKRGYRLMDDAKFYESLSRQFAQKKGLSPKQIAALKKLVKRYDDQVSKKEGEAGGGPDAAPPPSESGSNG